MLSRSTDREREDGPQDRAGQAREEAERREVAEDDVLGHVHREELVLAPGRERRDERDEHEDEAGREEAIRQVGRDDPAGAQAPHPRRVERRDERERHELQRLEAEASS